MQGGLLCFFFLIQWVLGLAYGGVWIMSKKGGFTLIELLVVVLIIGILAAVALPQYTKAVEKSRLAAALPLLDSVYKAQQSFYLANGKYAESLDQLDVDLPWSGTKCIGLCSVVKMTWSVSSVSNNDWILISGVRENASQMMVALVRTASSNMYSGAGVSKYAQPSGSGQADVLYCMERTDRSMADNYCNIIGYNSLQGGFVGYWRFYVPN